MQTQDNKPFAWEVPTKQLFPLPTEPSRWLEVLGSFLIFIGSLFVAGLGIFFAGVLLAVSQVGSRIFMLLFLISNAIYWWNGVSRTNGDGPIHGWIEYAPPLVWLVAGVVFALVAHRDSIRTQFVWAFVTIVAVTILLNVLMAVAGYSINLEFI